MPEFTYADQVPRSYTETRDAAGEIVGTVEIGDARDFDREWPRKDMPAPSWWPAPDERWVPSGGDVPPAWEGVSAGMYRPGPVADEVRGEEAPAPDPGTPVSLRASGTPVLTPGATTAGAGQEDED
jgi:hypothetical protein